MALFLGFFTGPFGVDGAIRLTFLTAFNFTKGVYLAISEAIAFLIDSTRLTTYFSGGVNLSTQLLYGCFIFIPACFAVTKIANKFVD